MLGSDEIKTMIAALAAASGGRLRYRKLRYHRIIIMTDGGRDGSHIRTLLLHVLLPSAAVVIENGYVYIAQPPLFRVKRGKSETYIKDERDLDAFSDSPSGRSALRSSCLGTDAKSLAPISRSCSTR
jgi:DNA gyrase subunit B